MDLLYEEWLTRLVQGWVFLDHMINAGVCVFQLAWFDAFSCFIEKLVLLTTYLEGTYPIAWFLVSIFFSFEN